MVNGVILASQDVVNSLLTCKQTTENSFPNTFDVDISPQNNGTVFQTNYD